MNSLDGRTVVVTGASAGVGAAAARRFTELGATVVVVGRSPSKTAAVANPIGAAKYTVDYSRLDDVRELAGVLLANYPAIDILANNAGGHFAERTTTADGFEATFQVNYLAPFLLTTLLLDRLGESGDARVITTSSDAHRRAALDLADLNGTNRRYSPWRAYANSKLGNILFTQELARRSKGTSVTASTFHPGFVASDIFRDAAVLRVIAGSPIGKRFTPEKGARPLLHLATVADAASVNGAYFRVMKQTKPRTRLDAEFAHRLWDRTALLLG